MPSTRPLLSNQARLTRSIPWLVLTGTIVVWLGPITLAGRMPIAGDVTSFFLPLMAYYRQALIDGRVPLWNELWGFGFPMLAESQAGVFYPPHLILFRLFETETAYSINIVLHYLLAGWFAYYCGREFGFGRWAAVLTGLVFAGNGFFIIHFPHQWSYTTGCWMPLAVGLAWRAMRMAGRGGRRAEGQKGVGVFGLAVVHRDTRHRLRAALGLALVLAVQMLAGHFQLAFYTQVVVLLLGLICTIQYSVASTHKQSGAGTARHPTSVEASASSWLRRVSLLWTVVPTALAFLLAAVQLLPTRELVRIALPEGRDFEYLSGFANTPFHMVSYLLPTLFHVNPLWRPTAWDPFHTSPEECFSYVGLLPLCLALGAAWRWRRESRVRLWVLMVAATLVLGLGPYEPLFRGLIRWPGFNGFRAASRWSVATALFLALLAGRAIDGALATRRLRRWVRRLVIAWIVFGGLSVGCTWVLIDGGNPATPRPRLWTSAAVGWAARVWSALSPWNDPVSLFGAAQHAHEPRYDLRMFGQLADLGYRMAPRPGEPAWQFWHRPIRTFTLADVFPRVLLEEVLTPALLVCVLLVCLHWVMRGRRVPRGLVIALVIADLAASSWLRPSGFAPRGRLVEQSAVLGFLAGHARNQRVQEPHQNLPMLAGAAPIESYRTVDIPMNAQAVMPDPSLDRQAWRQRVSDRFDLAWAFWGPARDGDKEFTLTDPLLGRIDYGRSMVQAFPRATTEFTFYRRADAPRSRAWFWDADQDAEGFRRLTQPGSHGGRGPADMTYAWLILPPLTPVRQLRAEPEFEEYEVDAGGPGAVVVSALGYPGWQATLSSSGIIVRSETDGTQSGCRVVQVPAAGKYRLELTFRSRAFERGRAVSLIASGLWLAAMLATLWRTRAATRSDENVMR